MQSTRASNSNDYKRSNALVDVPHRHRRRHRALHVEQRESKRRGEERRLQVDRQHDDEPGEEDDRSAPPMCGPKSTPFRIGANTGSTIRQISIQSKKKPRMKTRTIRKIRISQPVSSPAP